MIRSHPKAAVEPPLRPPNTWPSPSLFRLLAPGLFTALVLASGRPGHARPHLPLILSPGVHAPEKFLPFPPPRALTARSLSFADVEDTPGAVTLGTVRELRSAILTAPDAPWWAPQHPLVILVLAALILVAWAAIVARRVRKQAGLVRLLEQREAVLKKQLQDLLDNTGDCVFTLDRNGNITTCNRASALITGYSRENILRMRLADLVPQDHLKSVRELIQARRSGGEGASPIEILAKDGRRIPVEARAEQVEEGGETGVVRVVARDLSPHKRAEEALRKSEARFKRLAESEVMGVALADLNGRCTEANDAFLRMVGRTRQDLASGSVRLEEMTPPEYQALDELAIQQLKTTGVCTPWEKEFFRKDNSRVPIVAGVALVEGVPEEFLWYAVDLTERKLVEAENTRLIAAVEQAAEAILITDPRGTIHYVNPAFTSITGYSREEALGQTMRLLKSGKHDQAFYQQLWQTILAKRVWRGDIANRRKDGSLYAAELTINPVLNERGEVENFVAVQHDVTERRRAEEALRQTNLTLGALVEASPLAIVILDHDGNVKLWSPAAERIFGWKEEEVLGRPLPVVPEDRESENEAVRDRVMRGEAFSTLEAPRRKKDGTVIDVSIASSPLHDAEGNVTGRLTVMADVSERKALELRLRQSQKMEAVGRLAGGIAHDFNNLLTIITGYSDLLLERLEPASALRGQVQEIKKAGERAAGLTKQLLAFSRQQVLEPKVLDLNAIVTNTDKMLRRLIGEDIELLTVLDPNLWQVRADPGQIEQVIFNLAVNARDAMPNGGKLTIETANVALDETYARSHVTLTPGQYAMLAVSDTGCGMDKETQSRIFEPFFTTKEQGKGTGLGLATVYGIIKQSGGYIWVYSEPQGGTAFKVYLPRAEGGGEAAGSISRMARKIQKGSETILLVEDEKAVRELAGMALQSKGYTVLAAPGPVDALQICEQYDGPIHLLLTDVIMPTMSGHQLAEHLLFLRPQMKVLYMSGYTDDTILHHGVLNDRVAFLQKPFGPDALAKRVREVLDTLP